MRADGSADDAASVVANRLLQAGPRGMRPGDPNTSDVMVDCYLHLEAAAGGDVPAYVVRFFPY